MELWSDSKLTHIIANAQQQSHDGEEPEDGADRLGHLELEFRRGALDVEGYRDDDGRDGHVHGELQVREEGCFFVLLLACRRQRADTEATLVRNTCDGGQDFSGRGGLRLTSLVGTVVARIAALVLEEQRAKWRPGEEDG